MTTIFPADCTVCAGPMTAWRATPVCDACVARVKAQTEALCAVCGEALGMESARTAVTCMMCRTVPPAYTKAVAFGVYEDELREMLHRLKYGGVRRMARGELGEWLAEVVLGLEAVAARELMVVAVPLFAARMRARGFNQSELLADAAIVRLRKLRPGWTLRAAHGALQRVKDTREQYVLNPRERRANLQGAFRVSGAVRGREVLLVDDVMTTGATARECARVLVKAGAAKVWVATLARAQAESVRSDVAVWDGGRVVGFG